MSWFYRAVNSSIGGKFFVAITGLMLVGFVIAHLSGNLLVFAGPEAINAYARKLRDFPALLWALRLGLLAATVLHVYFAIKLNINNKKARPDAYKKRDFVEASWASRQMVLTGMLVLFYVIFHLAHFTWRITSPDIGKFDHFDVYNMLMMAFSDPLVVTTYIIAMVVLGFHLSHGISSVFQTLGMNHTKYNKLLRRSGPAFGFIIAVAYISIPAAIFFGFVR